MPEPLSPTIASVSPRADLQRDVAHRADRAGGRVDFDGEAADVEHGAGFGREAREQGGELPGAAAGRGAGGVDGVAQRVAQAVHGEDGQGQGEAGPEELERGLRHGGAAGADHQAPGGGGRDDAEAEEGEAGFEDDGGGGGQAELDEDGAADIGQDGAQHDAQAARAQDAHGLDMVLGAHGEHAGIDDADEAGEEQEGEQRDEGGGAGTEQGDGQEGEQQGREAQDDVHAADGEQFGDAAEEAAGEAEHRADEGGGAGGGQRDEERDPAAPEQPGQHVAAVLVLAEPMGGGGAGQAVADIHGERVGQR